MLIGVITAECYNCYQSEIIRGIISQAFKSSCDIIVLSPINNNPFDKTIHKETELKIFDFILSEQFSGFIYDRNVFQDDKLKCLIEDLCRKAEKPVMALDYQKNKCFDSTTANDFDGIEAIANHLIEVHNYKRIYCLTGPKGHICSEERLKGYLHAMKSHGLEIDKSYYEYGDFWINAASNFAQKIISGKLKRPDAVICGNDFSALSLINALTKNGIRVPEDIAVTGYDFSMDSERSNPTITSYKRPNFQLGADSFRRLYHIITGKICEKIPNENGELRIGRSCGCDEKPILRSKFDRRLKTMESFDFKLLFGDMLFSISNSNNINDFISKIDNYTHLIYKFSRFCICITENFEQSLNGLYDGTILFNSNDKFKVIIDKSPIARNNDTDNYYSMSQFISKLRKGQRHPSAFYLSALHNNENFFGFAAVSFGKNPITYSKTYIQWINYVNVALEQIHIKAAIKPSATTMDKLSVYNEFIGLPNYKGIEKIINEKQRQLTDFTFINIELPEIKNLYYQNGDNFIKQIIFSFSNIIKKLIKQNEICGFIYPNCFCIITDNKERTNSIFHRLRSEVINSDTVESSTAFTVGAYTVNSQLNLSLSEILHKAAANIAYSYTKTESVNPQFEKLCMLRNDISQNPELSWNIGEIAEKMYISKSYLQKLYKSYFGKSIIEETIYFRIQKAKKLLLEADSKITIVAAKCGYSSYNYFTKQFSESEGISPSEFKKKNKSTQHQ